MPTTSPAIDGEDSLHFGETFARRTLPAIVGLLLLALLVCVTVLVQLAWDQDRKSLAQGQFYADKAIQARKANMLRTLTDYAFWGDAYQHLSHQVDLDWAYQRQNLGPTLFDTFAYEGVLVLGPSGETTYAVIDGQLRELDARQWLQGDLGLLLTQARRAVADDEAVIGLFQVDGRPALVAAAEFTTGGDLQVPVMPGPAAVLLFVDLLSEEKLLALGQEYALPNLRVAEAAAATQSPANLPLGRVADAPVLLSWDPAQPGQHLLSIVLPLMGGVALFFAALAWLVLRHALKAARLMDAGYTRLAQSRADLAASEERFRDVAEIASDWFWETDEKHRLTYLSERFEGVTGLPRRRWLGRPLGELLDGGEQSLSAWLDSHPTRPAAVPHLLCRYRDQDDRQRLCRIASCAIPQGGFRGTASDITEEVAAQARIHYLSHHDSLTGLPNRHRLHEFLEGKLSQAPCLDRPLVMLSIDLNRFKPINDAFGHAAGDRVLHEVSQRLRECIRDEDLLARHGGDEFIMVLSGTYTQAVIEQLCTRLIERIERPYRLNEHEVFIGASIGITLAPHDASQVEELLRYANIALYQAKASGPSGWRFYDPEMNLRICERRQLEQDLRLALGRDDQLCLHFQPRYRLDGLVLVGAEALIRWQHPQRDLLGPDRFIALAEETGLIAPLGDWVLRTACHEAVQWKQPLLVSVNLSPLQFRRSDLVARVKAALDDSGLPAHRLELEITENVMLDDAQGALITLKQLKALGLRLSMDDFGTGYSSLSYLRNYPFDALKIDRSFISGLDDSRDNRAIVQAIIGLGRALSMTVTAEGVETQEQLRLLQGDGCYEAQGFYLSRPLSVQALGALLHSEVDA
ncbi:PAS domain S-box-containing protein/diguanylate cyclase (GGDEF) domain-containing protein [Pseudomonas benzenivorans]|nr:EAL domain-containing protein [Pseudomonas benzenivorans]SDH65555.1 PAS domain S-box-containing protein/diguanylate cyclase (GGDEF) domain-containing protein [Pseudomonas benzenivorans]